MRIWCGGVWRGMRMLQRTAGAGGKKLKKKERDELIMGLNGGQASPSEGAVQATQATAPKPKPVVDEEEDIFGDAGTDYKPSVAHRKKEE